MQRIWIVTKDENIAAAISTGLRQDNDCEICTIPDFGCRSAYEDFAQSDVLVVDLETASHQTDSLMKYLIDSNPDIAHIALVPAQQQPTLDEYLQFGVDEIIIRPTNRSQTRQMVTRLRESVAAFDLFLQLKKTLLAEMRERQIIVRSKPMRDIMCRLPQLAMAASTVLISGETGAGKELFARAIHYLGPRAGKPFIALDCGALPENLVENELFGHVRGAYTDADLPAKGLIREAHGGTLFLDEVEALPLSVQTKFLRFLQERQYRPLGQANYIKVDVRVLAATNIDLVQAVKQHAFRADLYYRLSVVPLSIPPLRERKSDIPALAYHFLQKYAENPQIPMEIPKETMGSWLVHDWPGNVRELENRVQEWLLFGYPNESLDAAAYAELFPKNIRPLAEERQDALTRCDLVYLQNLLTQTKGNISYAARLAEIDRKNLRHLLKKYGIDKELFRH